MPPKVRDELIERRQEITAQIMGTLLQASADKEEGGARFALQWCEAMLAKQQDIYASCESRDDMLMAVGAEYMLQNFFARWKNGIPTVPVDYTAIV